MEEKQQEKQWKEVDGYFSNLLLLEDPVLKEVQEATRAAGLPEIEVSPALGQFLHLLVRTKGARKVLEVGTLGGYSTIFMARALPADGRLISLEVNPAHGEVARKNISRAGLTDLVEIRIGPALESLAVLAEEKAEDNTAPFDLVFIDADKTNNAAYFEWALELTQPGSLIIIDNVVRNGAVLDGANEDQSVQGARQGNQRVGVEKNVTATAIQTVGIKGYDGFLIARVNDY